MSIRPPPPPPPRRYCVVHSYQMGPHHQAPKIMKSGLQNIIHKIQPTDHSRKYHNIPLCSLFISPEFCISIVYSFSWRRIFSSQEKLKTMLMQNFGVANKEHYGMVFSAMVN